MKVCLGGGGSESGKKEWGNPLLGNESCRVGKVRATLRGGGGFGISPNGKKKGEGKLEVGGKKLLRWHRKGKKVPGGQGERMDQEKGRGIKGENSLAMSSLRGTKAFTHLGTNEGEKQKKKG